MTVTLKLGEVLTNAIVALAARRSTPRSWTTA